MEQAVVRLLKAAIEVLICTDYNVTTSEEVVDGILEKAQLAIYPKSREELVAHVEELIYR